LLEKPLFSDLKKEINHHEGHMVKLSNGYYYSLLKFKKEESLCKRRIEVEHATVIKTTSRHDFSPFT